MPRKSSRESAKAQKERFTKPVGFQLEKKAFGVYSSLAAADRNRPVGTMCAIILQAVAPLAALIETDRTLTVDEILRRAGLDGQAREALARHSQNGQE